MDRWAAAGGMCLEASGCEHCQRHQKLGERVQQTLPQGAQRTSPADTSIWTSDLLAVRENAVALSHQVRGHLLWQSYQTSTVRVTCRQAGGSQG